MTTKRRGCIISEVGIFLQRYAGFVIRITVSAHRIQTLLGICTHTVPIVLLIVLIMMGMPQTVEREQKFIIWYVKK